MSARSAQRTRWRRWRMGWDYIAGRKVRRKTTGHKSSIGADVTVADVLRLLLFPPFALRASHPAVSYTFRFHGLHRV